MRFEGRRVLITGAAAGFGRLAAERFAAEGARLSLADRDAKGLADTAAQIGADVLTTVMDVGDETDQRDWHQASLAHMGGIDIALNNAGVIHPLARIEETPVAEFDRMMAVNARGVFLGLQNQLPIMKAAGAGCILNTASVAGLIGSGMFGAYVASKHAVVGLTKTAADEAARFGVRVNAVCPAFAETPMLSGIADDLGQGRDEAPGETYRRLSRGLPMRRVGTAEEIVSAMLMLCDPSNSFMTGQAVAVDGGLTAI